MFTTELDIVLSNNKNYDIKPWSFYSIIINVLSSQTVNVFDALTFITQSNIHIKYSGKQNDYLVFDHLSLHMCNQRTLLN